eukprot:CAMPEP_0118682424 /NCGR_PEP_ID=MMETSP0800-20121206/5478_1 /TAXON_ID=210618 ORGANISM="Striatella unipunctata, Strain CCMP2910" /NCGR_SAMPLE_ID=MMETSP0800 /ASSEMBLY_ACC=CAM_ASM_000638 /LENGTH=490 /DNA_ID=CAMNT_0006578813 /DNA_START=1058 /DNA_END=2530 /DNA_ORIENTATION=-
MRNGMFVFFLSVILLSRTQGKRYHHRDMNPMSARQMNSPSSEVLVQESPQCWKEGLLAVYEFQHYDQHGTTQMACASLSYNHLSIFAIELARCHMLNAGRPFSLTQDQDACHRTRLLQFSDQQNAVKTCLSEMTDLTFGAYTEFITLVHDVCARVTEELVAMQTHQTTHALRSTTLAVVDQMSSIKEQQDGLHQLTQDQHTLLQEQAKYMQENAEQVSNIVQEIEATHKSLQPLMGIERMMKYLVQGYGFVTCLIHGVVGINLMYLISLTNERLYRSRGTLVMVVAVECCLELFLYWLVENDFFLEHECREYVLKLRRYMGTYLLIVIAWILCFGEKKQQERSELEWVQLARTIDASHREMERCREQMIKMHDELSRRQELLLKEEHQRAEQERKEKEIIIRRAEDWDSFSIQKEGAIRPVVDTSVDEDIGDPHEVSNNVFSIEQRIVTPQSQVKNIVSESEETRGSPAKRKRCEPLKLSLRAEKRAKHA